MENIGGPEIRVYKDKGGLRLEPNKRCGCEVGRGVGEVRARRSCGVRKN